MSSAERRMRLFVRQSDGLGRFIDGIDEPVLLCPLCLRLWGADYVPGDEHLRLEHAPPKQYPNPAVRCFTCSACNGGAGKDFERVASAISAERQAAIDRATGDSTPLPHGNARVTKRILLSIDTATRMASAHPSERRLELKSAFTIAFAALGHRYAMGSGLDLVREIVHSESEAVPLACFRSRDLAHEDRLLIARSPLPCVMVPHPTKHLLDPNGHMVVLPMPGSSPGFFEAALRLLAGRQTWEFVDQLPLPKAYRPPFTWDLADPWHLGSNDSFRLDYDCECGEAHDVGRINLRLGASRPSKSASTL